MKSHGHNLNSQLSLHHVPGSAWIISPKHQDDTGKWFTIYHSQVTEKVSQRSKTTQLQSEALIQTRL